jgi:cellulose synthase (UDP-forming)
VLLYRRFWMAESQIIFTAEKTWSMIGFAFVAFLMSVGGVLAALESWKMKEEDPWDHVNLESIKTKSDEDSYL